MSLPVYGLQQLINALSVGSRYGAQGVYTYKADDVGQATATMNARSLAYIMNVRLIDRRTRGKL